MPSEDRHRHGGELTVRETVGTAVFLGLILLSFGLMTNAGMSNGRLHRAAESALSDLLVIEEVTDVAKLPGRTGVRAFGHLVSNGQGIPGGLPLANETRRFGPNDTIPVYRINDRGTELFVTEQTIEAWKPVWHVGSFYFSFLFPVGLAGIALVLALLYGLFTPEAACSRKSVLLLLL